MSAHHKTNIELQTELQLVEAAKLQPEKFGALYDAYYKTIFVFIYRRTDNEDITADLTSQVFLKALMNIKKYEYKGVPFSAWLFRIALNEVNMFFRKTNTSRVVSIDTSGLVQLTNEVSDSYTEEQVQQMMLTIKELEAEEIQLIELRFFENNSFAEIAGIVGTTEGNAKVKLYRILDKLKKILHKKIKL